MAAVDDADRDLFAPRERQLQRRGSVIGVVGVIDGFYALAVPLPGVDLVKRDAFDLKEKTFLKNDDIQLKQQVSSSLLVCIADIFENKIRLALEKYPEVKAVTFVGGVACNKYIRNKLKQLAQEYGLKLYVPAPQYCTDNAAMIAFVGAYKAKKGQYSSLALDILT